MDLSLAHLKKVLKFGSFALFFTINSSVKAYIPEQLKGKYAIKEIDTLQGGYWLDGKIQEAYGGSEGNKLIYCPSAMVDEAGVLWTASFEYMQDYRGLGYELDRHEGTNGTITTQCHCFYPWALIPNVTPKCGKDPNLDTGIANDPTYFQNYIHNILQPCVAQEIGTSSWVCMFIYCPPTRYMNATCTNDKAEGGSIEGLMYFDFNKNAIKDASYSTNGHSEKAFYYHTDNRIYSFNQQHLRKNSEMTHVNLETGNYTAWHDNGKIHLNFIATNASSNTYNAVYHQYNSRWPDRESITTRSLRATHTSIKTYSRYIKFGDHVYGMIADPCWNGIYITKQGMSEADYTTIQNWSYPFTDITHNTNISAHNYDFCIVKAKDGTGIVCVLGLRPTCASSTDKTELSATYNEAWNNTYTNWNSSSISDPICLMLSSCKIDKEPSYIYKLKLNKTSLKHYPELCYESPQNIIYSTDKTSFSQACDLYCSCRTDDYEYHDTQLYKNTHKCCVYTSPSGNQYIIYAYCYPGKTKKCYLGYAQCIVDSNYKVQLLTKTEFSKGIYNEGKLTDMESIGEMNTCEYIVSLDCKGPAGNENVWLTWRYDSSDYYIFHIAAKDLVGE